jgi:hypothetical protein
MTNRSWIARAMVSGSPLVTILIAVADPGSQHAGALLRTSNTFGVFAASGMAAVSVLGLVDVLVNDRLPGSRVRWLHRNRHLLFMCIAGSQMGLLLSLYTAFEEWRWVMAKYLWDAAWAVAVAVYGVVDHCRQASSQPCQQLRNRRAGDVEVDT